MIALLKEEMCLADLPVGSRLVIRAKDCWRTAFVSQITETAVVVRVCSPTGRTYRIRRDAQIALKFDNSVPFLESDCRADDEDCWRKNFAAYDSRW